MLQYSFEQVIVSLADCFMIVWISKMEKRSFSCSNVFCFCFTRGQQGVINMWQFLLAEPYELKA